MGADNVLFKSFLLVLIIYLTDLHEAKGQQYSGSQCFHVKGVPSIQLKCPGAELIKTSNAFFGAPTQNTSCGYKHGEKHCIQLTDLHDNCNGRYMCSVYVSNPFLMNCRTYATYMQVNYTCIPKMEVHDICTSITTSGTKGYIRTPHYPDANYTSNVHCGCKLKTEDTSINLHVLDFSVNHTQPGVCNTDYMRIPNWGKKCGHIGPSRLPEKLEVNQNDLALEFHTDATLQARGFWLEYQGSEGGDVSLTCGQLQHTPSAGSHPTQPSGQVPTKKPHLRHRPRDRGDNNHVRPTSARIPKKKETRNEEDRNVVPGGPISRSRPSFPVRPSWESSPSENSIPSRNGGNSIYEGANIYVNRDNDGLVSRDSSETVGRSKETKVDENVDNGETTKVEKTEDDEEEGKNDFSTYEFNETQETYYNVAYNINTVQIITGVVVGVLILIAVIIIVVLVFRR